MTTHTKKPDTIQYALRLPVDLREALEDAAKDQERTLSQEIIFRLRRSLLGDSCEAQK